MSMDYATQVSKAQAGKPDNLR